MRLFWKTLAVFILSVAVFRGAAIVLGPESYDALKSGILIWFVVLFLIAFIHALRDGHRSRRAMRGGMTYEEAFGLEVPAAGTGDAATGAGFLKVIGFFALMILVLVAIGAQGLFPGNSLATLVSFLGQAVAISAVAVVFLSLARYSLAQNAEASLPDHETDTRPVGNPFYGYTTYERNYPFSSH